MNEFKEGYKTVEGRSKLFTEFKRINQLYFTNIEKVGLKNKDFIFKRRLIVTFENGFVFIIPFSSFNFENLQIIYESKLKNRMVDCQMLY